MNPISEHEFNLLADAVRRRRRATCSPEVADGLESHDFRVMALVDDLAEGESLNGVEYRVLRTAAILHAVARPKSRPAATADASAALGVEMLESIGADDAFIAAVEQAIRRHAGWRTLDDDGCEPEEEPQSCAEQLVHDACLLARIEATSLETGAGRAVDVPATLKRLRQAVALLQTGTARRIAAPLLDAAETTGRTPAPVA